MSKKLIVDAIESQYPSRAHAERAVDSVMDAFTTLVKKGERITLREFGTFSTRRVNERMGRNISTGEPMKIAARDKIAFKPSKVA